MTDDELRAEIASVPYWYHRVPLRPGIETPGWAPIDAEAYRVPDDLTGERVLDIGAWDGYWSFEAAKRGATSVVAVDNFSDTIGGAINADRSKHWRTFDLCRDAIGLTDDTVCRLEADVCSIDSFSVWDATVSDTMRAHEFNRVFCFGVLYHLRHPLLALENMRELMAPGGSIHIETAILDNCQSAYSERGFSSDEHAIEFYPGDEFGSNPSNWWNMTLRSWVQLVEAAGFKNVTSWKLTETPTHISQCRGFIRGDV